jgi:hypothetical protein
MECEKTLNEAIGKLVAKIYKKEGVDINESLKNEIIGYGGAAILGLGGLGYASHQALDTIPQEYTISKEQMDAKEKDAVQYKKERDFYLKHAEELYHTDPSIEGFVFDKENLPEGGGVISIMIDTPFSKNRTREDQYARRRIIRYFVDDEDILTEYNIGDYINYTDLDLFLH